MRKIHRLDLDFAKDIRTQRKITFKEQDSITLYMSIYNDGVPVILDNQTPRLFIKKSDGTILYQTEVLSVQNNVVAFDVHRQATTCPGLCYAEVEFIEDEELITTRSFVYIVEPKVGSIKDAIASVDEAYFLKVVEDFIAQAKLDIAEFRDAVASLENRVIEADDKLEKLNEDLKQADLDLNEAKENALEEISDLRYEAIDDIQEARDEGIDTITLLNNETVQIIDQIKNNSINLIIDEKDNSIKEMAGFKDACLEAIELLKNGTVSLVYQAKNNSINEINDTVDRHLTTIRNNAMQGKADIINLTKTSKEEITGLTNESKEAIEALGREVIDNIDDYTIEHIEELESIIESLIPTVGEARELETSLINLKESLTILKDALQKLNADGLLLNDKLEVAVQMARTTQNELLTAKNEAISVKVALNQVIEATESLKNALITENERAEANIAELNVLHPEADIRIIELRDLIQQAIEIAIPALKSYIADFTPALDLTEVNEKLEELYSAINTINIQFNNYYTKEEVDAKFELLGIVGESSIPGCFASAPKPADDVIFEMWAKNDVGEYLVIQSSALNGRRVEMYIGTASAYVEHKQTAGVIYKWSGSEWNIVTSGYSTVRVELINKNEAQTLENAKKNHIFYNSLPIYKSDSNTVYIEASNKPDETVYNDYNTVINEGYYKISHREEISNCPAIIQNGHLDVKSVKDEKLGTTTIYQEAKCETGNVYTRTKKANNEWTEWKEVGDKLNVGKISGSTAPIFDELPSTFTGYPENPDASTYLWEMKCTHYNHHMIFYFDTDPTGKFGIVEKTDGNLGFKLLDTSFTYKTYKGYYRKETSSTGSWTAFGNDNHFTATNARNLTALYYHNFNIVDGNNPDNIYRVGDGCSIGDIISDFNKATEYKEYIVDIKAGTTASNSPAESPIKGILKVSSVEGIVHQTLEIEDKTYKRIFNGTWSKWYLLCEVDIPEIDMSNIYTKEEVDEKVLGITPKIGTLTADTTTVTENVETDFNKAHKCSMYNVRQVNNVIPNSPMSGELYGVLKITNVKALIHQTLETTTGRTFKRMLNGTWTAWKEDVKKNEIENLLTSVPNKINTFTYTNSDGMPEVYKWFDLNGLKIMWIDVKLSESEYNSGSTGAMMKTLNFPAEAQIFKSIIMTNITSYNRSGNDTLSRVIQNSEIISNVSVRGRWRHTDNTPPSIDRFTIMCFGF